MATSGRFTDGSGAPRVADPEFDPRGIRTRRVRAVVDLHPYQRLLANPFLALTGLTFWSVMVREALRERALGAFLIALGVLLPGLWLLHYHCLDCGATDVLWRWRRHECSRVVARMQADRPLRFPGPTPTIQLQLWLYLLGIAALARLVFH